MYILYSERSERLCHIEVPGQATLKTPPRDTVAAGSPAGVAQMASPPLTVERTAPLDTEKPRAADRASLHWPLTDCSAPFRFNSVISFYAIVFLYIVLFFIHVCIRLTKKYGPADCLCII